MEKFWRAGIFFFFEGLDICEEDGKSTNKYTTKAEANIYN